MTTATLDSATVKIREIWAKMRGAGMSLTELGLAMGYPEESARQAATQFLRAANPTIGSIRRFARAVNVPVEGLVR
ncbi:MAG: hypothetical protein L0211_09115 [Planctomycetaceae bacterium]|nr:hypothetical protein [Planctomycetaceae bacterium]